MGCSPPTFQSNKQDKYSNLEKDSQGITIESYSFDIPTYPQRKANAINALIDLDVTINDNEISDQILEGHEQDFRHTDFLFFQSTRSNSDHHQYINDILVYLNTFSFKIKYGEWKKTHKAYFASKSKRKENNKIYFCEFCKKSGHTAEYSLVNPDSKKDKGTTTENKPKFLYHAITIK